MADQHRDDGIHGHRRLPRDELDPAQLERLLPNAEFMRILREAAGVPFGLPASRWMLEVGAIWMRTDTELILKSRRVVPARLLEHGFTFRYPD